MVHMLEYHRLLGELFVNCKLHIQLLLNASMVSLSALLRLVLPELSGVLFLSDLSLRGCTSLF